MASKESDDKKNRPMFEVDMPTLLKNSEGKVTDSESGAKASGSEAEAKAEGSKADVQASGIGAEAKATGRDPKAKVEASPKPETPKAANQREPTRPRQQNRRFFEGCGEEGLLRAIFLSEFHTTQGNHGVNRYICCKCKPERKVQTYQLYLLLTGPMIRTQVPNEVVSKDLFDVFSTFIIPKQQLTSRTITTTTLDFKILGYPVVIENKKYKRNQYMFNVCFVCYSWSRSVIQFVLSHDIFFGIL